MQSELDQLEELAQRVHDLRVRPGVSADVEAAVREVVADVRQHINRIRGDNAYRKIVEQYVAEEAEKLGDQRTEPVCTCERTRCPLKRGDLPGVVLRADDIDDGIDRFRRYHADAPVLREAQQEFDRIKSEVETRLSDCRVMLERDRNGDDDATEVVAHHR